MLALFNRWVIHPLLARRSGSRVFEFLRVLEQSQYDDPEVIRARQLGMLKQVLQHAYDTVPYYQAMFRSLGLHPSDVRSFADYEAIPVLTKKDIRTRKSELLSNRYRPEDLMLKRTSGSTGVPLEVLIDKLSVQWKLACTMRSDQWSGWRLGQRVAKVWGNPEYLKHGWKGYIRNRFIDRAIHLDTLHVTEQTLTDFVGELQQHQPGLIFGHAHSLYLLACHMKRLRTGGVRPNGIISTAMLLHTWQRQIIEEVFQCPVTNRYGCEESSLIASECEVHEGLHLNSDSLYHEILPDRVDSAETQAGSLVVTDLTNFAMPLLRYQIGDVVVGSGARRCSCGRGLSLIERVEGREADYVVTRSGKMVSGISLTENFALHIDGTAQVQIVQEQIDLLRLRIVRGDGFGPRSYDQVQDLVTKTFHGEMRHEIEFVDGIPQEASGKYRFCISNVAQDHLRAMSA